ncbi:hypothetical protein [Pontiella sulfatireligans]|uniref:Uncharacterized protein n=1 Tax=Pontiella sulfatireligans TaxID=2750658 RepID=A0A6C2US28_9BACT|nr:hypothetical protein [Pontiella sulfatireligans]VGO23132.1 hypothetical protein SCARR_05237 [Pontiella sulfatireligans]
MGIVRYDRNQQKKAWAVKQRKEQSKHQLTTPIKPVLVAQWRLRDRTGELDRLRRGGKHIRPMLSSCIWKLAVGSPHVNVKQLFGDDRPPFGCDLCERLLEHLADTNEGRQKVLGEDERLQIYKERRYAYEGVENPACRRQYTTDGIEPTFSCRGFKALIDTLLMDSAVDMLSPESLRVVEGVAGKPLTPTPRQLQKQQEEEANREQKRELRGRTPQQIIEDRDAYVAHYLKEGLIDETMAKKWLAMRGWTPQLGEKELG